MAIIKLGGVVTDIVGKVGGQVFQQGTYGTVFRNNHFRRSRQKSINYMKRSLFSYLAQVGRSLTQDQRDQKTASGLKFTRPTKQGPATPYDWWSLHMAFNGNLLLCGKALNLGGFLPIAEPDWADFGISDEMGTTNWQIDGMTNVTNEWSVVVLASPVIGQYDAFRQGTMKIIKITDGDPAGISITQAEYEAVFGTIATGAWVWFQVFIVNNTTGQRSQPKITKADAQ